MSSMRLKFPDECACGMSKIATYVETILSSGVSVDMLAVWY